MNFVPGSHPGMKSPRTPAVIRGSSSTVIGYPAEQAAGWGTYVDGRAVMAASVKSFRKTSSPQKTAARKKA